MTFNQLMRGAGGLLEMIRPVNAVLSVFGVLVAGYLADAEPQQFLVLYHAALSALCIGAFGNVVNDVFDREIDSLNRPDRPLPSRRVLPSAAIPWAGLLGGLGVVLASTISLFCFVVASGSLILLFVYSAVLKRTVLWGNILTAGIVGLSFVFGAGAVDRPEAGILPAILAFMFNLIREIVKDMEDITGDSLVGARTLPIRYGMGSARATARSLMIATALFSILPWYWGIFHLPYLVLVGGAVIPGLVLCFAQLGATKPNYARVSRNLKILMLIGLAAMVAGH